MSNLSQEALTMLNLFIIFLTPDFFSMLSWLYIALHFGWQSLIGMLAKNTFRRKERKQTVFGKYYNSKGSGKSVMKGIIEVITEVQLRENYMGLHFCLEKKEKTYLMEHLKTEPRVTIIGRRFQIILRKKKLELSKI